MKSEDLLRQLLAHPAAAGVAGGILGSLLTGKAGRKLGKTALQLGGLAAVAGLAYSAWRSYQAGRGGSPGGGAEELQADPAAEQRFLPAPERAEAREELAGVLLEAMLAAARADGRLDERERAAIRARLDQLDLEPDARAALATSLERPVDIERLVRAATTQERAIEIYTASLLAIDLDTAAERGHLMLLADRLALPAPLVEAIHREVAARSEPLEGFAAGARR